MSDWYYAADNEQKGPVNEAELKAFFATNKLPADTLVWKDGMDAWTAANTLPAFSFRAAPTPAAVQPGVTPAASTTTSESDSTDSTKPVDFTKLIGPGQALQVEPEDAETNKVFGILAYLGPLCLVTLIVSKDSPYARYHANQGLVLFLVEVVSSLVIGALVFIPFIGYLLYLVHIVLWLVFMVASIYGIINAAAGKCVPLPYIGGIKLIK